VYLLLIVQTQDHNIIRSSWHKHFAVEVEKEAHLRTDLENDLIYEVYIYISPQNLGMYKLKTSLLNSRTHCLVINMLEQQLTMGQKLPYRGVVSFAEEFDSSLE
jgi:hypothetical protein